MKRHGDPVDSDPSIIDLFQRALVDYRAGRLLQAQAAYRQILTIDPAYADAHTYADAHNNLGNVLYALGRPAEAEESWREALRLWPNYPEVHNKLGIVLRDLGRPAEAEESFREALRCRPNSPEAHTSNVLYALGGPAAVRVTLRAILRISVRLASWHRSEPRRGPQNIVGRL